MANVQQMQMKKECLEKVSLALGRQVTPSEGSEMLANVRAAMLQVKKADPDAWASMTKTERIEAAVKAHQEGVKVEAAKVKQRAYQAVLAQANVERSIATAKSRGYRGYSIGVQVFEEVDRRVQAQQKLAENDFLVELDGKQKGITGLFEDKDLRNAVVKEIYGVDSGSKIAKDIARTFEKNSEALRQRYNGAGGNMGKIEHYIPQTHDSFRLRHAAAVLRGAGTVRMAAGDWGNLISATVRRGPVELTTAENRTAWVNFIAPLLDRDQYIDINGNPMSDADYRAMLERAFDTITLDGTQDFTGSTVAGRGASRANKGNLHRAMHFKDYKSFLEYHDKFGRATIFDNMVASLRQMAKDAELLDSLGPNPNNTVRGLERVCEADQSKLHGGSQGVPEIVIAAQAGVTQHFFKSAWGTLNGDASAVDPSREVVAMLFGGARNIEVFSKLQNTFISSLTDIPSYYVSARYNNVPMLTATKNLILSWVPKRVSNATGIGKDLREVAARAGLMADALASNLARWGATNVGSGWTGKLANATMKVSLLDAFTNGVRQASMLNLCGTMANVVRYEWGSLPRWTQVRLNRIGVTEMDWKIWQMATPYEAGGARYLTREDIRAVHKPPVADGELTLSETHPTLREVEHAVISYQAFLRDESSIASLAPDLTSRTLTNIGGSRGTLGGEVARCFMLFKSFPIGFMHRHFERMCDLGRAGESRTKYAATIITSTTLLGAIVLQLRALSQGKDFQDMSLENEDFWLQALSTGGGAGFLTDLIVAGMDGENAYGSPNFLRFMGPVAGTMLDSWDVAKTYYNEAGGGLYNRQSSADAKALRFARGHLPFVNLWYLKGVVDRAVYNDLMEAASPGYIARMQKWSAKNTGQAYWWQPTEIVPERLPRMADAPKKPE